MTTQNSQGLRAATAVAKDFGRSCRTIARWAEDGWLEIVNIAGKPYITTESLATFNARARRGDYAKPPPVALVRKKTVEAEP